MRERVIQTEIGGRREEKDRDTQRARDRRGERERTHWTWVCRGTVLLMGNQCLAPLSAMSQWNVGEIVSL